MIIMWREYKYLERQGPAYNIQRSISNKQCILCNKWSPNKLLLLKPITRFSKLNNDVSFREKITIFQYRYLTDVHYVLNTKCRAFKSYKYTYTYSFDRPTVMIRFRKRIAVKPIFNSLDYTAVQPSCSRYLGRYHTCDIVSVGFR